MAMQVGACARMRCENRARYEGSHVRLRNANARKLVPPTVGGFVAYREQTNEMDETPDLEPYVFTVFRPFHAWHANTGFEFAGITLHGERAPGTSESIVCNNVANIYNTGGYAITAGDDVYAIPEHEDFRLPLTRDQLRDIQGTYENWLAIPPEFVRRSQSKVVHDGTATLVGGLKMADIVARWQGQILPAFNIDYLLAAWRAHRPDWEPLYQAIQALWQAELDAFRDAQFKDEHCYHNIRRSLLGFRGANGAAPGDAVLADANVPDFLNGRACLLAPHARALVPGTAVPNNAAAFANAATHEVNAILAPVNEAARLNVLRLVINDSAIAGFNNEIAATLHGCTAVQSSAILIGAEFARRSSLAFSMLTRTGPPQNLADYVGVFGRYVIAVLQAMTVCGLNRANLTDRDMTNMARAVIALTLASALGQQRCELHAAECRAILFHYYIGRAVTGAAPGGMFQVNLRE
jgi:hypothetical protein